MVVRYNGFSRGVAMHYPESLVSSSIFYRPLGAGALLPALLTLSSRRHRRGKPFISVLSMNTRFALLLETLELDVVLYMTSLTVRMRVKQVQRD